MKVSFDREENQLKVIAANHEEQDELAGLAEIMRHGDICCIKLDDPYTRFFEYSIDGAIATRRGDCLRIVLDTWDRSKDALSQISIDEFLGASGANSLAYLWAEEVPEDGWNVLVFGHA